MGDWISRFFQKKRRKYKPGTGKGLILLYHRVALPARDPQALNVTPMNFKRHIEILKEIATPMDLAELTNLSLSGQGFPENAVSISFDDGYADNIDHAEPILAAAGLKGTVFAATGFIEQQTPFWWDRVEEVFLGALPAGRHKFKILDNLLEFEFSAQPVINDDWTALDEKMPSDRHTAYMQFMSHMKGLAPDTITNILCDLEGRVGMSRRAQVNSRAATPEELSASSRRGTLKFHAHTRDHPQLALLSPQKQFDQIRGSYEDLRAWTKIRPALFSYPYGSSVDFNLDTEKAVEKAGFEAAFANIPGLICSDTPRWAIPRILIRDIDGNAFRELIEWSFNQLPTPRR